MIRIGAIAACGLGLVSITNEANAGARMLYDGGSASLSAISSSGHLRQSLWTVSQTPFHGDLINEDGLTVTLRADDHHLWLEHSRSADDTNWIGSTAEFEMFLAFSETDDLLVEWDFAGWDNGTASLTSVDLSQQTHFPVWSGQGDAGSVVITIGAGRVLRFVGGTDGLTGGGLSFVRFTVVPTPGATSLLAMAGLLVARRRR